MVRSVGYGEVDLLTHTQVFVVLGDVHHALDGHQEANDECFTESEAEQGVVMMSCRRTNSVVHTPP